MPMYDFFCKECNLLAEDVFFKIAEEKIVKCTECKKQMEQVLLSPPGLSDPGGIGRKWVNDGYQEIEPTHVGNAKRIVTEKWVKGKNVMRADVHDSDRDPNKVAENILKVGVPRPGWKAIVDPTKKPGTPKLIGE